MAVQISRAHVTALLAEAAASPVAEVCGLLLGRGDSIDAVLPCTNVASDPATGFEIDPAALIAAHTTARAGGPQVIGCYHSHPDGRCVPSQVDTVNALNAGQYWLIIAGGEIGVWRVGVPHQFVECGVEVGE